MSLRRNKKEFILTTYTIRKEKKIEKWSVKEILRELTHLECHSKLDFAKLEDSMKTEGNIKRN